MRNTGRHTCARLGQRGMESWEAGRPGAIQADGRRRMVS